MMSLLTDNIERARAMLQTLAAFEKEVESASQMLSTALLAGNKLLACGNGGSAAEASHLTTEFVCRFDKDRRPYPAISLATQGGDLTAIGNDYSFDDVFSRQVGAFGQAGDVLFVFTTSGASENVYRALAVAKQKGVKTVAMLGKTGGKCAGLADIQIIVPQTITARIQEAHLLLLHTICERVEIDLAAAEKK
jgi:D-sedoheptulose 7-phosphate isomerase